MADEEKKEGEKKESILSGFTTKKGRKKATAAEVDGTDNMKEDLVTATMVDEPPEEELVKADEELPERKVKTPPKTIKKDVNSEKPVYRKSDRFHLTGRPGGVSKYFNR